MKKYLQKLDTPGLLLLVAAAIYYSVTNLWNWWTLGLAIAGAVLVVIGIASNYRQILDALGKRSAKYAANYVISVVLVAALVSGLNFLGQRHPKRFDLTAIGRYSLAPQTDQVLAKLDKDLNIKAYFPGGDYPPLNELLTEYRTKNRHVNFEFIDPDKRPELAQQSGVTVYGTFQNPFTGSQMKFGTVVMSYGARQEKIEKRSEEVLEEDLTNAIIKVQRTEEKKIYLIQGHGEKDPGDTERSGYSEAKKALEEQAYKVETVNLASAGKAPADARVLIEAGPATEPFPQELQFINDYLNTGGSLLVMVDPAPSPSLESFLKPWGVKVDNDIVLDVSGAGRLMGAGPSIPLVLQYENHKITDRFRAMTFFPLVRSIDAESSVPSGVTVESLFKSNPESWGETDIKNNQASFDEKSDLKGPLSLAVAATKDVRAASETSTAARARIVAVGDSDFATNAYFATQGNGNLFLNMVSWLAQDEDLISIRPKEPTDRRIVLSQSQTALLRVVMLFLLPGIALLTGIVVWTRRRR
jgi:ABC-type uncharacterized transport system involved in gliding motility auxiliary subunit